MGNVHILSGLGPPDAIIPDEIGQHYVDKISHELYTSIGVISASDWKLDAHVDNPQPEYTASFTDTGTELQYTIPDDAYYVRIPVTSANFLQTTQLFLPNTLTRDSNKFIFLHFYGDPTITEADRLPVDFCPVGSDDLYDDAFSVPVASAPACYNIDTFMGDILILRSSNIDTFLILNTITNGIQYQQL